MKLERTYQLEGGDLTLTVGPPEETREGFRCPVVVAGEVHQVWGRDALESLDLALAYARARVELDLPGGSGIVPRIVSPFGPEFDAGLEKRVRRAIDAEERRRGASAKKKR